MADTNDHSHLFNKYSEVKQNLSNSQSHTSYFRILRFCLRNFFLAACSMSYGVLNITSHTERHRCSCILLGIQFLKNEAGLQSEQQKKITSDCNLD